MSRTWWLLAATSIGCTPFDQLSTPEGYAVPDTEIAFPGARVDGQGEVEIEAGDGGTYLVPYVVQEGMAVAGEDMILGTADEIAESLRSAGIGRTSRLWSTCTIPYSIDASVTAAARGHFLGAIEHWEATTSFRFEENTASNRIKVVDGSGCSSHVGYKGGVQDLQLSANCGQGAAIHEIGHALGLWHEQSRSDSSDHVLKKMQNVQAGREHNFETYAERGQPGIDLGAYDFGSLMHYGSWSFSTGTCTVANPAGCTITHLDGSYITEYQRSVLSDGDLAGIQAMYPNCGVSDDDDHGDTADTATALPVGAMGGHLSAGDVDFFRIATTPGHTVVLSSTGATDTYAHVLDAAGAQIAADDDAGEGRNFRVEFVATAAAYFVKVRGYGSSTAGDYDVQFVTTPPPDDHGNDGATATVVALDAADPIAELTGLLDAADHDWFRIDVPTAGTLTAVSTGATDTWGTLFTAAGVQLDTNDDTQGRNFAVTAAVQPGSYLLQVRGYAATTQGAYGLQVGVQ